ncbi:MAG TPA: protein tyrosine phosphatase family protein, partial [Polyangia bacterium]
MTDTMTTEAIKNFYRVSDRLGTGGQPTEAQLTDLATAGYDVVINLGLLDPRYCLPDEAGSLAKLGIEYHHIPVIFSDPTRADFDRFVTAMDAAAGKRVFVHCALNHRVSSFIGLYGRLRLGWSREAALAHARRFWQLDPVWQGFFDRTIEALGPHTD